MKLKYLFIFLISLSCSMLISCSDDENKITTTEVTVHLSPAVETALVELSNNMGQTFTQETDASGISRFTVAPGIYSVSVSKTTDNDYERTVYNGFKSDIVVGGESLQLSIDIIVSSVFINNPILIKEVYVGGCQKDDGSGIFSRDQAIVLYNNSSSRASLDSVGIGMIDPYNAEANIHSFLNNGVLDYEDKDWIPAINGIWYFQDGQFIEPYSELVINICGAIDNTQTYSNSVNYANPDYFCCYDVESTSADGTKYNNTSYYPAPSDLIPTSHYLKAVKYGLGNAWPLSQMSPAIILFKSEETSPWEFGNNNANIIYPANQQGNAVYASLALPRSWVLDAVEIFNAEKVSASHKRLTSDLDNGYVAITKGFGHSAIRKVEKTVDGHDVYQDTNNSSNDFYETESFSLR